MRASYFLTLALAVVPIAAVAEPLQSSEEIVNFFARAADLGVTRGICVGTEDECKNKADQSAPAGLDMLINFDLNSAALTPDAQTKLGEFAKALKDDRLKAHSFVVEGHTDASGSTGYNATLSQKRAQSVTEFLLVTGIEASRLRPVGMGETHPREADPYDGRNRRVEMKINFE